MYLNILLSLPMYCGKNLGLDAAPQLNLRVANKIHLLYLSLDADPSSLFSLFTSPHPPSSPSAFCFASIPCISSLSSPTPSSPCYDPSSMYIDLFSINLFVTPHHRLVLVAGLTIYIRNTSLLSDDPIPSTIFQFKRTCKM